MRERGGVVATHISSIDERVTEPRCAFHSPKKKNDTILAALQPACTTGRDHHKPTVADCTPRNRYEPDCTACWEFCMRACVREPGGTARVSFLFLSFVKLNASG